LKRTKLNHFAFYCTFTGLDITGLGFDKKLNGHFVLNFVGE
jgi:hypothetical protein